MFSRPLKRMWSHVPAVRTGADLQFPSQEAGALSALEHWLGALSASLRSSLTCRKPSGFLEIHRFQALRSLP